MAPNPEDLEHARTLTRLLDSAIRIPGTNRRFGLDAIIGLIPGVGDVAGAALSGYLILIAARSGAPRAVMLRMVLNVAIDAVLGVIPLLGDAFDFAWKASSKNLALMERYVERPAATKSSSRSVLIGVAVALGGLVLLAAFALVQLIRALSN